MEIIVGVLYAAIIVLGALLYVQKQKTQAQLHQIKLRANNITFESDQKLKQQAAFLDNKIEDLAKEVRDVLSKTTLEVGGLGQHVTGLKADYEGLQHEIAEFTASIDPDVMDKFRDRISILEMSVGVRRMDSAKNIQK